MHEEKPKSILCGLSARSNKSKSDLLDNQDRKINNLGYLINDSNDIINQRGQIVFKVSEQDQFGGIPLRFDKDKYNFNPCDILGNFDNTTTLTKDLVADNEFDLNGRKVNSFGYLIDDEGNIINRRGRRILEEYHLKEDENFPTFMNYQAKLFRLLSVIGTLKRDPDTGDAIQQQDLDGDRFLDMRGRKINRRGYLIDSDGNIINKKGDIIWLAHELVDGDFPKLPEFMKFDISRIQGVHEHQEGTPRSHKEIDQDPDLPVGCFKDIEGNVINSLGYLIDPEFGHIVDKQGKKVFDKSELVDNGLNIPFVFRKSAVNGKMSPLSDGKREQFETTEDELEEEGPSIELRESRAGLD